ncbi:MAG: TetR/AcrR family transcriptional regulator [Desulfobacteraceae bacterium]|nr:TetR/AcrR family transcriptional regulator [Desulfobacteraceae bacterium]MBC2756558.1 TetR/AcrR family transcriptional regulator [Desulfobacteraceae bacterium]
MKQKSDKRRQEIITAAMNFFAEKGYHSTKISDISNKLNMAHGTFYIYFQSKAEIFSDIVEQYIKKLDQIFISVPYKAANISEFKNFVQTLGDEIFNLIVEDQKMAQIIFSQGANTDKKLKKKIVELMNKMDQLIESILIEGINRKFLVASMDTEIVAKAFRGMLVAGINDVAMNEISMERKERWINSILRIGLDGLV